MFEGIEFRRFLQIGEEQSWMSWSVGPIAMRILIADTEAISNGLDHEMIFGIEVERGEDGMHNGVGSINAAACCPEPIQSALNNFSTFDCVSGKSSQS